MSLIMGLCAIEPLSLPFTDTHPQPMSQIMHFHATKPAGDDSSQRTMSYKHIMSDKCRCRFYAPEALDVLVN